MSADDPAASTDLSVARATAGGPDGTGRPPEHPIPGRARRPAAEAAPRGCLRVYLGAAPGVGKTYAMLAEAHRRLTRGADIVVGLVETHGRPNTEALLAGLEIVPRRVATYRDASFEDMDVDALLARRPSLALVDELAHTNVPGSRNSKRWQDVEELLAAGIDVLSTVNIQHLESLSDVVEAVTGVPQRENVPDDVVRRADQVELVDMAPEALRRRMAHGNIYPAERVEAAFANYFRVANLTALRELALLWMADKVDEQLDHYREQHGIPGAWNARERVVVALSGGPEGDSLIRRGARIAARAPGRELLAVHASRSDGLVPTDAGALQRQRELVESLGGSFHQVVGHHVPDALLDFARGVNATQLVLGASRRTWLGTVLGGRGVAAEITRRAGAVDIHTVGHDAAGKGRGLPELTGSVTRGRRFAGLGAAAVVPPALTALLVHLHGDVGLASDLLLYMAVIVGVAVTGGIYPAVLAAVASGLLADFFFVPPVHSLFIRGHDNVIALMIFLVLGLVVGGLVEAAARLAREGARARAEAATLSTLAGSIVAGQDALPTLLERVRETFAMESVTLLERRRTGIAHGRDSWAVVGASGAGACRRPEDADTAVRIRPDLCLALRGRLLPAGDRSVLTAFAGHAAVALERRRLAAQATDATVLAVADRTRAALLTAVSHDLRGPLASAKAAVTSLLADDVTFSIDDHDELLATADESLDRLTGLVENMLDMSHVAAGTTPVDSQAVGLDDAVAHALRHVGVADPAVRVDLPDDLPPVNADPVLLERVVAHLIANAARHAPPDKPPRITASAHGDVVDLLVIDRGPGVPRRGRERIFTPFQRLGDRDNSTGVGLGLAVARGLAEAMHGSLVPEDTPGGGLTMVLTLPALGPDGGDAE